MLKLILPLILTPLLLNKKIWQIIPMTLFLLTLISTRLYPYAHPITSPSQLFTLDHLSSPLISLTLWVCALTLPISLMTILRSPTSLSLPLLILLLTLILTFVFSLNNALAFYIMFEASLIPTLLLILIWGYQPDRLQAGFYMMMYTVTASLPLLFSILLLMSTKNWANMLLPLPPLPHNTNLQLWWLLCIFAFLVKIPLYSLHLWLPKAHVEAPTAGSMILASILLKLGAYGLIRISSLAPKMMNFISLPLITTSLLGAALTGVICIRQTDLKALIAYSSVAHMGLMTAGIASLTFYGWSGALMMMLAHGLSSPAMFSLAGVTYETTNTRSLFLSKGLLTLLPSLSLWWFISTAANMAAPPSMNLMSEILLITAALAKSFLYWPLIFLMTFLAVAYSLHLYTATQHGPPPKFLNPTQPPPPTHTTSLFLITSPLFLLMLKPEILLAWLP